MNNLERALLYLRAVERGDTGLTDFFHPDMRFHELPNRLVPAGQVLDLAGMRRAAEKGQTVCADQRYDVQSHTCEGDSVALEIEWTATLKVPLGATPAGGRLRARIGCFLTFREGRIVSQRNYDCYDPTF